MISDATRAKYDRLVARCHKAGIAAAKKKAAEIKRRKDPAIVVCWRTKKQFKVWGYPYGFVNLHVENGRSGFVQYLKEKDALGWQNSIYTFRWGSIPTECFSQSMEVQEAEAKAWQEILDKRGINTRISSRID